MNTLPKARTENIVEQNLKQETLIYDLITNQAFNLNETLSIIYKACDGATTFTELKRKYKFSDDFIYLALDELKQNELLAKGVGYVSPFANTSRREVIKKVGLATMLMLPLVSGLVAPTAAQAASGAGGAGPIGNSDDNTGDYAPGVGVTLFGACYSVGKCNGDSEGPLTCIDGKCCRSDNLNKSGLYPGERIPVNQSCSDTPGTTVSCSSIPDSYGYCCDGGTPTGTCTTESSFPIDEESGLETPCPYADGTYLIGGYISHCDCYCP